MGFFIQVSYISYIQLELCKKKVIKILWHLENHPKIDISEKKSFFFNVEKLMIQHFYMGSLLIIHEYNPKQEIVR